MIHCSRSGFFRCAVTPHLGNLDTSGLGGRRSNSSSRCGGVTSNLEQACSFQGLHHAHHLTYNRTQVIHQYRIHSSRLRPTHKRRKTVGAGVAAQKTRNRSKDIGRPGMTEECFCAAGMMCCALGNISTTLDTKRDKMHSIVRTRTAVRTLLRILLLHTENKDAA